MNFATPHRNYTGLAIVVTLHLVAAGIALKNSTVWITRAAPGPIAILPPKPLPPAAKPAPVDDFDVRPTQAPVMTERLPDLPVQWEAEKTISPTPPRQAIVDGTDTGGGTTGSGGAEAARREPVTIAAVIDAASCARPAYPAAALRNGDEGTVTLAFLVGKDGRVASAKVERTSGHRDLDRAALQGLALCAFKPGTVDGVPYESWSRMQYAWRLND